MSTFRHLLDVIFEPLKYLTIAKGVSTSQGHGQSSMTASWGNETRAYGI